MPHLISRTDHRILAEHLKKAKTLKDRIQGLIGKKELKEKEVFWIPYCTSIHTFFMKFPIDVVFTDRRFQVVSLFENVSSRKILWGGFRSQNVFEMKKGQINKTKLKKGEILYVEH